jgi:hypothetical protein
MGLPLSVLLALVVGVWAWRTGRRARGVALATTVILGVVLAIGPWTARNFSIFGQVVPICTNGPINLFIGNNPHATGVYQWHLTNEAQAVWNRPNAGRSNELFSSQIAGREAIAYILNHRYPSRPCD